MNNNLERILNNNMKIKYVGPVTIDGSILFHFVISFYNSISSGFL